MTLRRLQRAIAEARDGALVGALFAIIVFGIPAFLGGL